MYCRTTKKVCCIITILSYGINCDSPTDDDFVMLSLPMAGIYNMQHSQDNGIRVVLKKVLILRLL